MNKGFTLVELAIVIVIIGLLVGGVLQGQQLIEQAKINSTVSKVQSYNAAANTFKAKYGKIPGDINNASGFGLNHAKDSNIANICSGDGTGFTATSGGNGNGDNYLNSIGFIACNAGGGTINKYAHPSNGAAGGEGFRGEIANFFVHLSNAQLVKESFNQPYSTQNISVAGLQFPTMPVGSGMIILTEGYHHWVLGTPFNQPANSIASFFGNSLTPSQAASIDIKSDDGNPLTGLVEAVSGLDTNSLFVAATGSAATCVFTGGTTYNMAGSYSDSRLCTLRVQANF